MEQIATINEFFLPSLSKSTPLAALELWYLLLFGHFLADYPLQGDFLSKAKNFRQPIPGVDWYHCMLAHCGIHAGFVALITGSWLLAVAELIAHFVIDCLKCVGKISYATDQLLHYGCKAVWVYVFYQTFNI